MTVTDPSLLQTQFGTLRGVVDGSARVFWKIPFCLPPLGELRWKPPVYPPASWAGVRDATVPGPINHQPPSISLISGVVNPKWEVKQDEDCLQLNVFAPSAERIKAKGGKLPVMYWIYGGGYSFGGATLPSYDATEVVKLHDVIIVTANYRLNVWGFLGGAELKEDSGDGSCGNYGIQDQACGLRWVRENISTFGGDPENVTCFGQSAGGMSVHYLMLFFPNLFKRGICQSGVAPGFAAVPMPRAQATFDKLCTLQGLPKEMSGKEKLARLRAIPADKLWECYGELLKGVVGFPWRPTLDGVVITESERKASLEGKWTSGVKEVMIGDTQDEGTLFPKRGPIDIYKGLEAAGYSGSDLETMKAAYNKPDDFAQQADYFADGLFYEPIRTVARAMIKNHTAKVHMYRFNSYCSVTNTEDPRMKAHHSVDVLHLFINRDVLTKEEQVLAEKMLQSWVNFASTGNPGWQEYDGTPNGAIRLFDVDRTIKMVTENDVYGVRKAVLDIIEKKLNTAAMA